MSALRCPAGSSRLAWLDPSALPVRYGAPDAETDDGLRHIELDRERAIVCRTVRGVTFRGGVPLESYSGIGVRRDGDDVIVLLIHRNPTQNVPLHIGRDDAETRQVSHDWSAMLGLPLLDASADRQRRSARIGPCAPSSRRERRATLRRRRPGFLFRRKAGLRAERSMVHRNEHELIARN